MTSAALLRKMAQAILQEQIIPDLLRGGAARLVTARLPLEVPVGIAIHEMAHPPLQEAAAKRIYPEGKKWDDVGMHAIRFPSLYCMVEGEADLAMGVTTSMPTSVCGGYIFSLRAPAYFLVPPGVPQKTAPPWQRTQPHTGTLRLFVVRVLPIGALCTVTTMQDGTYEVPYSLLVKDSHLAAVMGVLVDELSTPSADSQIVQAQLLSLMLRLKRHMLTHLPQLTDGLYSRFPDSDPINLQAQPLHQPLIERAHEYIQLNLHEVLNPARIAAQVQVTPDHLNRTFKNSTGVSLMNYVTQLRMESARLLLRTSNLSVQEISQLVGYRYLPHFSRTFLRHSGYSPLKFRQQEDERK